MSKSKQMYSQFLEEDWEYSFPRERALIQAQEEYEYNMLKKELFSNFTENKKYVRANKTLSSKGAIKATSQFKSLLATLKIKSRSRGKVRR
jgi:hypothetical protein